MSDEMDETEESGDVIGGLFDKHDDEFLKFERIPISEQLHPRPDLCAFLYLHQKLGGKGDVVGNASHDMIYLDFDNLERLTEADIIYIKRCGIGYEEDTQSLYSFV